MLIGLESDLLDTGLLTVSGSLKSLMVNIRAELWSCLVLIEEADGEMELLDPFIILLPKNDCLYYVQQYRSVKSI